MKAYLMQVYFGSQKVRHLMEVKKNVSEDIIIYDLFMHEFIIYFVSACMEWHRDSVNLRTK